MSVSVVPSACLVVVSTGTEAKLFRNAGKDGELKLVPDGQINPEDLDDEGPSGSFVPDATDHDIDEATFAKQLAGHLYQMAHSGKYEDLVLVADPVTLGQMRPLLHKEVTDKIVLQMDKTLINSTTDEIQKILLARMS